MRNWLPFFAALAAGSLPAGLLAQVDTSPAVASFVKVTNDACLPTAEGSVSFQNSTPAEDEATVSGFGIQYGINGDVLRRFGREGSGVLNRAIMGHQAVGEDLIVLAIGGALPGCKVILLRSGTEDLSDEVAAELADSVAGWRELPFEPARLGSQVSKRSFIFRNAAGEPFILNLINPSIPNSQIRLVTTINRIPPHVKIPEGY